MADSRETPRTPLHRSPALGVVAIVFVVLFAASIVASILITDGAAYPNPYNPIGELQDYYTRFPDAIRWASFLQVGAMFPLAVFAASIVSRLRFFRIDVAGPP